MAHITITSWSLLILGTATLGLDAYAIRKVCVSGLYETSQRWAQTLLILLVPLMGAFLALYLCRDTIPMFQSAAVDHLKDIDATCADLVCDD